MVPKIEQRYIKKAELFGNSKPMGCLWGVMLLAICCGCKSKNDLLQSQDKGLQCQEVSKDRLNSISETWKSDTSGCLLLRRFDEISLLIKCANLVGEDSSVVIKLLGPPNHISIHRGQQYIFVYYMECGKAGTISYSNVYCDFDSGILKSYRQALF